MSDHTSFQLTIYACPPEGVAAAIDVLNEFSLGNDWSPGPSSAHEALFLNRTYTDHELRCGESNTIAGALVDAGATFECWEDPKYEYLGDYHMNVSGVGYFTGECDADGNLTISAYELLDMVETATDLETLRERIEARTGSKVSTAIAVFRDTTIEVELAPLEDANT